MAVVNLRAYGNGRDVLAFTRTDGSTTCNRAAGHHAAGRDPRRTGRCGDQDGRAVCARGARASHGKLPEHEAQPEPEDDAQPWLPGQDRAVGDRPPDVARPGARRPDNGLRRLGRAAPGDGLAHAARPSAAAAARTASPDRPDRYHRVDLAERAGTAPARHGADQPDPAHHALQAGRASGGLFARLGRDRRRSSASRRAGLQPSARLGSGALATTAARRAGRGVERLPSGAPSRPRAPGPCPALLGMVGSGRLSACSARGTS